MSSLPDTLAGPVATNVVPAGQEIVAEMPEYWQVPMPNVLLPVGEVGAAFTVSVTEVVGLMAEPLAGQAYA